jgi:hypothetical protein
MTLDTPGRVMSYLPYIQDIQEMQKRLKVRPKRAHILMKVRQFLYPNSYKLKKVYAPANSALTTC